MPTTFSVNTRILIRISYDWAWDLQENEVFFSKNCLLAYFFCIIDGGMTFFISCERFDVLYKKTVISEINVLFSYFRLKNLLCLFLNY